MVSLNVLFVVVVHDGKKVEKYCYNAQRYGCHEL